MAATSALDEPELSPSFRYKWDVFLSFRGEDTRHGFTDKLYRELNRNGIRTYRDNEGLERGDDIAPSLLEAIEESASSVAVISRNYASSRWCLEELAKIFECRRLIFPVFYGVDPSDVMRQSGSFEEGFRELEQRFGVEKVDRWRKAMDRAGRTAGWVSRIWDEEKLIESLVKKLLTKLSNTPMGVAKYPVRLHSRVEELTKHLDPKAGGVKVVGLHGMSGIGKTTLAKAVYDNIGVNFKRRGFLSDIRETSGDNLIFLQNKLIGNLSKDECSAVNDISSGICMIKNLTHEQPVLVVLDDVDDVHQVKALVGNRDWFCEGSRIIITTRNKDVLTEDIVSECYEVEKLIFPEALQLFSYHAFGKDRPPKEFVKCSEQLVLLMDGLPLALEVIGSYMFDKRRIKEWEDQLQKLRKIRPGHLHDVLEISFKCLDEQEKCIFLDIACFFVQMKMTREDAIAIFKGCGFNAEIAVTVLTTKSLIKIVENVLWMHDQLRDMGRLIVQREDHGDPGKRSRLWDHDEIMSVLLDKKGTRSIQGIVLDMEKSHKIISEESYWVKHASFLRYLMEQFKKLFHHKPENEYMTLCTKSFKPMVVLRLLKINNVKLKGNFKFIPAEVKWLQWKGCPFKCFPIDFCPRDLAVLDLSESEILRIRYTRWWGCYKNKVAEKLLVLNLQKSFFLTEIPDLSQHRQLEKLNLEQCPRLVKLHKSLGDLNALVHLNLKDCSSLVEFPADVSGLKSLEILILSGCLKLEELPENIGRMKSLRELLADDTAIEKLPVSVFCLNKLERLSLQRCKKLRQLPIGIRELNSLRELILNSSGLEEIPDSIRSLTNLEILHLMHTPVSVIPESIGDLRSLVELRLDNTLIKEVPASIGNLAMLKYLSLRCCQYLTQLPNSIKGVASLVRLTLDGTRITEIPDQFGNLDMT